MKIEYKNKFLNYDIVRKNIKNINIRIEYNGNILITCPINTTIDTIENIIRNKIQWIITKLKIIDKKNKKLNELQLNELNNLLFLGKVLSVHKCCINTNKPYVVFRDSKAIIYGNNYILSNLENIKKVIYRAFKKILYTIIEERIDIYRKLIKARPNKISIKNQKTIWGSCSSNGNLSFNYRLIMTPLDIIDYVVIHELCHLVHMNHSKEYWKLVKSVIPDYELKKNWLNNNVYIINMWNFKY